jgi:hypothetical protein
MTAASFLLPAAGLAVWVVHVAQSVSPSRRRWAFWVWLLGLPAAVVFCFEYVQQFVPVPPPADDNIFAPAPSDGWDLAIFLGIVEWGLLLVAEPFLQLFLFGPILGYRRRRRDPAGVELEDTLELPIVEAR